MAPRIEKILGTIFGQSSVKRKESADRESSSRQRQPTSDDGQQYADEEGDDGQTREGRASVDRAMLEKAIAELRSAQEFRGTGMAVEIVESPLSLHVRFVGPDGAIVKTLKADEFVRQKSMSSPERAPRGKILDQKF